MRTSAWKATTAAALGLALLFAFRPPRARPGDAAPPTASTASTAGASTETSVAAPGPGGSAPEVLSACLRAARGTEEACDAIEALGRTGDATAHAVILDATRARAHVDVRQCALSALRYVPGEAALDRLVAATHEPEPALRDTALTALAERDDELSRATVQAVAQAGEPSARVAALGALASARVPGTVALIESAMASVTPAQQALLATALGDTGDPAAAGTLARLAISPVDDLRGAALVAAAKVGGPAMTVLEAAVARGEAEAVSALDALSGIDADDARALLVRAADDPRPAVAAKALAVLASFDGEDVRAAVVLHVGSTDPAVATAAARWLALRGDGAAVASLVDAAQRLDDTSANEAIGALAGLETDAAHAAILSLASRPGLARERALRELAGSPGGAEEARALAIRMMRDEGGSVAQTGLNVLASDDSPEATQRHRRPCPRERRDEPRGGAGARRTARRGVSGGAGRHRARAGHPDAREVALVALGGSKDPRATPGAWSTRRTIRSSATRRWRAWREREGPRPSARSPAPPRAPTRRSRAAAAQALVGETPPALLPRLEALARDPDEQRRRPRPSRPSGRAPRSGRSRC